MWRPVFIWKLWERFKVKDTEVPWREAAPACYCSTIILLWNSNTAAVKETLSELLTVPTDRQPVWVRTDSLSGGLWRRCVRCSLLVVGFTQRQSAAAHTEGSSQRPVTALTSYQLKGKVWMRKASTAHMWAGHTSGPSVSPAPQSHSQGDVCHHLSEEEFTVLTWPFTDLTLSIQSFFLVTYCLVEVL